MTNFRPTSLSPEALEAWDEAEANIEASMQRIRELTAPLRRPKPPSLKEQSLALLDKIQGRKAAWDISDLNVVRRALEALDD